MITHLKKGKETVILDLPDSPKDVTLPKYVQFIVAYNSVYEDLTSEESSEVQEFKAKIKCLEAYFEFSFSDFTIDNAFQVVDQLFMIIYNSCFLKNPNLKEPFAFEHKGVNYVIPKFYTATLLDKPTYNLTVSETIECMEVKRIAGAKKDKEDSLYNTLCYLMAVLSREVHEDGSIETFPTDQAEIETFIQKRAEVLQDICFEVPVSIAFFLTPFIQNLKKTHITHGILAHHKSDQTKSITMPS